MRKKNRITSPKGTIFDCLLCRILALALAGEDYSIEMDTARTLARVLEGGQR